MKKVGGEGDSKRVALAAGLSMALLGGVALGMKPAGRAAAAQPQGTATAAGATTPQAGTAAIGPKETLERLRDYLRIDTSNPPGNEIKAARFFKEWFEKEGIASEIFEFAPGRANIVARLKATGEGGAKGALILSNHMDVVNAERPYWSVDPFAAILKDGYIYGRGALDMKTTGMLEAVTFVNLKRSGARLSRDLIFLGTADEEAGASGIEWVVKERPDLLKGAEFMLTEGGVIDAVHKRPRSYNVAVTEKVPYWLAIKARGRPGHGSMPFSKENAVLALLRSLDRLSAYETPIRVTPAAEAYFKARAASERPEVAAKYRDIRAALQEPAFRDEILAQPELNAILRNTIAITMLQGAPQTNIIPTVAEARVDVRLLPDEDPSAFLATIRKIVEEPGVTVEPTAPVIPATISPVDSDLVRAIDRARARRHPDAVLAPTILTGWTESASVRPLGIKAYGFEPYILDQDEQERTHGNDERISIANVLFGASLMDDVVRDLCR